MWCVSTRFPRLLHLLDGEVGDVGDGANDDDVEAPILAELLNLAGPLPQQLTGRQHQRCLGGDRPHGGGHRILAGADHRGGLGPLNLAGEDGADGDGGFAVTHPVAGTSTHSSISPHFRLDKLKNTWFLPVANDKTDD